MSDDDPAGDRTRHAARVALYAPGWLERVTAATEADVRAPGAAASVLEVARLRGLFRVAFARAPIGMAIVDASGQIVIANDALCHMTGHGSEQLGEMGLGDLVTDDAEEDRIPVASVDEHEELPRESSLWLRRADGTRIPALASAARDDTTTPHTLIYQFQDVSERHRLEERLRHLVDHDLLTGLSNRRRFDQELTHQRQRRRRSGEPATLVMLDLDGFKAVNDRFGHSVGDELLTGLAQRLAERCRETDVLARISGDEFALLLPGTDRAAAESLARDVVRIVRDHASLARGRRVHVTASVGVAPLGDLTEKEGLALADAAMYAAKEAGGDRLVVFEPGEPAVAKSHQASEAGRLRRALEEQRFVLHAQPILDLGDGQVAMHELLIRMQDETAEGLIPPNAFLYAAERFGLIQDVDRWVISQAVDLIAERARQGVRVVLSVNLSGRSIGKPGLEAHIDARLRESGIDPTCLVFELTETAAIANIEAAIAFSRGLKRRGCRFGLDDFGAGFASFYYLKKLPFDFLKIDGDFVAGMLDNPVDRLVVGAIVTIAQGMGKTTIAESVSSAELRDLLAAEGVDFAQGFHLGRPRATSEVLPSA